MVKGQQKSRREKQHDSSVFMPPREVVGCAIEPMKALTARDRASMCLQPC
jgi:hypothetical protein